MDKLESLLTQVLGEVCDLRCDLGLGGQGGGPRPLDPSPPCCPATPPQEASEEREKGDEPTRAGDELMAARDETTDTGAEPMDQDVQHMDQGDDRADDGVQPTRSIPSSPHHDAPPTLPERGSLKGFFSVSEADEVPPGEMEAERTSHERACRRMPKKVQPLINVTLGPMAECNTSRILECSMSDKQFTSKAAFEAHHKGHRFEGRVRCHECHKMLANSIEHTVHMQNQHSGKPKIRCIYANCASVTSSIDAMKMHVRVYHAGETQANKTCVYCGRTYSKKSDAKQHMQVCEKGPNPQPIACLIKGCTPTFSCARVCNRHMTICKKGKCQPERPTVTSTDSSTMPMTSAAHTTATTDTTTTVTSTGTRTTSSATESRGGRSAHGGVSSDKSRQQAPKKRHQVTGCKAEPAHKHHM